MTMEIIYPRCCGLDVHQKTVVACLVTPPAPGLPSKQIRTFGTTTAEILALADWLTAAGCTHVVMESTGIYWRPVYNLLEGHFTLLVVNAQHVKAVPGRKTDIKDAEWLADLLRHGLLRASFVPAAPQRALRDLTRYRISLGRDRARHINRLQKVLEGANLKLGAVVSDIMGVSARAMLAALLAGETDPTGLANLAQGRLRSKRAELAAALSGRLGAQQRFLVAEHLSTIDYLEEAITRVSAEITERLRPQTAVLARLDTIPGINQRTAEVLVAEVGVDLSTFPDAEHLASWAGLCPGQNESAGKHYSGRTRKGNVWLRQALMEAAHGAAHQKEGYLSAQYRRLVRRIGRKKALVALAHSLVVIVYHVLTEGSEYRELGGDYFVERDRAAVERRLVRRLEQLGNEVVLTPKPAVA